MGCSLPEALAKGMSSLALQLRKLATTLRPVACAPAVIV